MRQNVRHKSTLHSSNKIADLSVVKRRLVYGIVAFVLLALVAGVTIGYLELRALCRQPCKLADRERQVVVHTSGQNIKAGLVLELFALTNGNNLATIDFSGRRAQILRDYPAIRDLTIRRLPPDRVEITVEERDPVARMSYKGNPAIVRVVDSEGMVFPRSANRSTLPVILEPKDHPTPCGKRLEGRRLAALRLIEHVQLSEFSAIGILDVDVTSPDYLKAKLGNGDPALISWEGMDEQLPGSQQAMARQMRHLRLAIQSRVAESASALAAPHPVWNATRPNYCFADIKEPIQ